MIKNFEIILSISLLLLTIASVESNASPAKELCDGEPVKLTKISQVLDIIADLKGTPSSCCLETRQAILEAEQVLKDSEEVCSEEKSKLIKDFHMKYIAKKGKKKDSLRKKLPKPMRKFMIAYGLQVSSICKKTMINNLLQDSHSLLSEADFERMDQFTNDKGGVLGKLYGKPKDFDDIILASDLYHPGKHDTYDKRFDKKIFVKANVGPAVKNLKLACQNRYKPFYEKLILPIVRLADVGYNYKGDDMKVELAEIKTNPEIGKWYSLVYLCEIINTIELVDAGKMWGTNKILVDILSDEEAAEVRADEKLLTKQDQQVPEGMEKIDYQVRGSWRMSINDLIYDDSDKNFAKLVDHFDASLTPFKRVKHQFFSKVGHVLKDNIKNKKLDNTSTFMSQTVDSIKNADEHRIDLVSAIDEFISESDNEEVEEQETLAASGTPTKKKRGIKYGLRNSDGSVSELKNNRPWWKISAHQFKKFMLSCFVVGALAVFLLIFTGLIG